LLEWVDRDGLDVGPGEFVWRDAGSRHSARTGKAYGANSIRPRLKPERQRLFSRRVLKAA